MGMIKEHGGEAEDTTSIAQQYTEHILISEIFSGNKDEGTLRTVVLLKCYK